MQVVSRSPLTVGSLQWKPRPGAHALTVICKATFRLAPEQSPLAEVQEPVALVDVYLGGDPGRGLAVPSDAVPWKRQPEVILVGSAYAPDDVPTARLTTRLSIGEVDKAIEVTGDRHFSLDGTLSAPARFTRMPLVWERAAGGRETANPVGIPMGSDARADGWGRVPLPNLTPPDRVIAERRDFVPPVGFGPIAPHWSPRQLRLQSALSGAPAWDPRTLSQAPLPPELDRGYFNAAPADQLLRELRGDERLVLVNLLPKHPRLLTRLETVKPRAEVEWGKGTYEVVLACDTLFIDTDKGIACLTYRGTVALEQPDRPGWIIVSMDGPGGARGRTPRQTLVTTGEALGLGAGGLPPWLDPSRRVEEPGSARSDRPPTRVPAFDGRDIAHDKTGEIEDEVTFASDVDPATAGPRLGAFRLLTPVSERPPSGSASVEDLPTIEPLSEAESEGDEPITQRPGALAPGVPAEPLAGAPAPPMRRLPDTERPPSQPDPVDTPPIPRPPLRQRNTLTSFTMMLPTPLPFGAGAEAGPETVAPRGVGRSTLPFGEAPSQPGAAPPGLVPALEVPPPVEPPVVARPFVPLFVPESHEPPPSLVVESTEDVPRGEMPAAPARMGPLATYEMALAEQASLAPAAAAAPAEAPAPAAAPPPPLPTEKYDLERCARIDASIARTPAEAHARLEAEELTADSWPPVRDHWAALIRRDAERGQTARMRAYDEAYVGQLEAERGPLAVDEYGQLSVAVERGSASAKLAELGLPDASLMRIQRVWMQKTNKDPELRRLARSAVDRAREE